MTGIRSLAVVSRRALASLGAALAVAFIALSPGAALAGDGDRQVSKMRVTIATGTDDLRNASNAVATLKYTNASGNQLVAGGNLNNGAQWPGGSTKTVTIPMPVGIVLSRLLEFSIQFTSGQPDIFATGDNWNMNSITVTAILDDGSEANLVVQADSPWLHRFQSDYHTRWATPL
ncbi:hypothetical protein [Pyxidicoccus trucidator]|uniref:hypothetical protein n=1 Tax=Pyxidicoccus trucidator TaxID=2709662 RepID=UPI001F0815A8|nr:hypothetical protein [Pyxidicoccus trucidator]